MVDNSDIDLDRVFGSLANATRRRLVERLRDGPQTVGRLAEPFDVTLAAISKHLLVLERAGVVRRTVDGRETWCTLSSSSLDAARSVLDGYRRFWGERLDELEAHFEEGSR